MDKPPIDAAERAANHAADESWQIEYDRKHARPGLTAEIASDPLKARAIRKGMKHLQAYEREMRELREPNQADLQLLLPFPNTGASK